MRSRCKISALRALVKECLVESLNKPDAGVPEQVSLVSWDEASLQGGARCVQFCPPDKHLGPAAAGLLHLLGRQGGCSSC